LSLDSALGVGQAIASAQMTAVTQAFHYENLEMLPSEVARLAEVFGEEAEVRRRKLRRGETRCMGVGVSVGEGVGVVRAGGRR
jgi:hypothetical protein